MNPPLDPTRYKVDANGCWIWTGSVSGGNPIMRCDGRTTTVRRALSPGIAPNQIAIPGCGVKRCVNPDHIRIKTRQRVYRHGVSTNKGMIRFDGSLAPRAYVVDKDGCWIWQGQCVATRKGSRIPIGIWRGKQVSVRQVLAHAPPKKQVDTTCGTDCCVNPDHLVLPSQLAQTRRGEHERHEIERSLEDLRNLIWVRSDLLALIRELGRRPHHVRIGAWNALVRYATGDTLRQIAADEGVSFQAISDRIKRADRQLRKYRAQTHLR